MSAEPSKHFELAVINIDQITEVSAETWQVHVSGFIKEDDEESAGLDDFNYQNWYDTKDQAIAEARLLVNCLIKTDQVDKCIILLSGNEIDSMLSPARLEQLNATILARLEDDTDPPTQAAIKAVNEFTQELLSGPRVQIIDIFPPVLDNTTQAPNE